MAGWLLAFILISCLAPQAIPEVEISNGILTAEIYLPDTENGYYRATRFDWAGIISSLTYKGHNYFGEWHSDYNPTSHRSITGPVDYFKPLNYDEISPKGSFVKIGVGSLTKTSQEAYHSFTTYPIADPGTWKIKTEKSKIEFLHVLNHELFPYEYTKTLELVKDKPILIISSRLKNTGDQTIETQAFNHNFFVFDKQPIQGNLELSFQQDISCSCRDSSGLLKFDENKIIIPGAIEAGQSAYCDSIEGLNNRAEDYKIQIDSYASGAGVRITGNQPISKLVFWCQTKTVCPEPYIDIRVEPGEELTWEILYEFYTLNTANDASDKEKNTLSEE